MPKIKFVTLLIAVALLMLLVGCGSGDKGPVSRVSTQDLVSAGSGTDNGSGGGGGGGGGGGAGACTDPTAVACVDSATNAAITQTTCQQAGWTWHAGQTCAQLGY